jgi:DnaA family protein
VYHLQVLSEPERQAVLKQEALTRGLILSDEPKAYMLNRFSRDLSSLMTLLDHLDQYALQAQRPITIPLIKSMLENA